MLRASLRSTFFALLIVAAGALPIAAQPALQLTEIKFGNLGPSPHQLAIYVADREGFFRDEGLRLSTVSVGTASNVASLLAAGEVQIANDGADSYVIAIARHAPLKIIGTEVTTNPFHLMTIPSVTSWAQLEGKSIAVGPTQNGDSVLGFYAMLAARQRSSAKFMLLGGGNSKQRFEALQLGSVQGALLAEPYDFLSLGRGMRSLATARDLVGNDWMSTTLGVNATWAAANRGTVVHFMRAACKGVVFAYAHRTETIAIIIGETGEEQSVAERFYDRYFVQWHAIDPHLGVSASALERVERMMRLAGMLKTFPSNAEIMDHSYAKEAGC
jgi:ABC-type nitrate/sulfonate/bicarbonate transport system substrate-binding protein